MMKNYNNIHEIHFGAFTLLLFSLHNRREYIDLFIMPDFGCLIRHVVNQGCIKPLCDLLVCPDPRIVTVCLEGLENILKIGEIEKESGNTAINIYTQMIDDCDGLDKIENLQSHDNHEIYEKAVKILERYWIEEEEGEGEEEEEEEQQNIVDGTEGGLSFGSNQPSFPAGGFKFG